nr:response regulator transcription factor [Aquisediminimonas profunda]
MRILIVCEVHPYFRRLDLLLSRAGFVVERECEAELVRAWPKTDKFSAIFVDLDAPQLDGLDLVRHWRSCGLKYPILAKSGFNGGANAVDAYGSGVDNFVAGSIQPEEIVARLLALVRRACGFTGAIIQVGAMTSIPSTQQAFLDNVPLDLTPTEYRLLNLFLLRAGQILAHDEILDNLYPSSTFRNLNTVEVHVGRLRRKIGNSAISTIRGMGYRLEKTHDALAQSQFCTVAQAN